MICYTVDRQPAIPQFLLHGQYRVQSKRTFSPSLLAGEWYSWPGLIGDDAVNRVLEAHPAWNGQTSVALKPALVRRREGTFEAEPDVLYKRDLFIPEAGSAAMPADIVDILKSQHNWQRRVPHAKALFGDAGYREARQRHLAPLGPAIANEYVLHEAGHLLGYDIGAKQRDGYFAPNGKTAWNLVYLEELRADLNAFGFAVEHLAQDQAAQVLVYNMLQRFAVHREGIVRQHQAPYGLVPYLLFCLLSEIGFLSVKHLDGTIRLQLTSLASADLADAMRACAQHAEQQLNGPELACARPFDCAIAAAGYIRRRLMQQADLSLFALLMEQPLSCEEAAGASSDSGATPGHDNLPIKGK